MTFSVVCVSALVLALAGAQRPFYAGSRPIGQPEIVSEPPAKPYAEDPKYPFLGPGDAGLVDKLKKRPEDQQPFWLLNAAAYQKERENPKTWEQKPNPFIE